jgi:tetratricopeptide (TPR) repeat protein
MAFWSGLTARLGGLFRKEEPKPAAAPPAPGAAAPPPAPRPATVPKLDAKGHFERAVALLREGEVEKSMADFDRAIELDPNFSQAYATRGVAHERAGRAEEARRDYAKSIEIDLRGALKSEYGYDPAKPVESA